MTVRRDNETDVGDGMCLSVRPKPGGREMPQKSVRNRQKIQILAVGVAAAWICIVLCLIQLLQVRTQLKEQREQIERTYNMVQLFHSTAMDGPESLDIVSGSAWQSGSGTADIGAAADENVIDSLELSYAERCGLDYVDKPQERNSRQVLERLEELGRENERIAAIYQNSSLYPESLLEALANNPEMTDFVEGWLMAEHKATGGLTESEKEEEYPLFLQWDPRWGYASYGNDSCIAVSGCGPTCLSMVLYYLTGDESLTPDVIGDFSMANGYYLPGTGTLWALMEDTAPLYGIAVSQPGASEWGMKAALDRGGILICSMRPGDFTAGGHFIVIYGYDQDGFLINDPNCVARSRQSWTYDQIGGQIKHLWVFEKGQSLPVYDNTDIVVHKW